jgi:hypothetical protein
MKTEKFFVLIVLAISIAGCKAPVPTVKDQSGKVTDVSPLTSSGVVTVATPTPALTDKAKIALLRAEAHKRGLRWLVVCEDYEKDPSKQFFAMAEDNNVPIGATYIEEGAKPWWAEDGETQADAAYRLYLSIQQPPNIHPSHRGEEHAHKKWCPPELRGN